MNPKHALRILGLSLFATKVLAEPTGQVRSVYFKTSSPPPAFVVPKELRSYEGIFRAGLTTLPERMLVNGALTLGGQPLGLTSQETTNLSSLLTATYARIAADSAFAKLPSALPYCLSARRNTNGHYFISMPQNPSDQSPVIAFLHGYGGNFQFYLWALRGSLPEAIVVCPSWNESWYGGSPRYLQEAVEDARLRFGLKSTNQWLMGISAGGRAGFTIYPEVAKSFRGYICLAAAPEATSISQLARGTRILMINGTQDEMAPIDLVRNRVGLLRRQVPALGFEELPADHFFILSHREQCFQLIRQFYESK